jgi:hypothetical protein
MLLIKLRDFNEQLAYLFFKSTRKYLPPQNLLEHKIIFLFDPVGNLIKKALAGKCFHKIEFLRSCL